MQINSITNKFNINNQNRKNFSKNQKVKNIVKDAIKNCDVEILFEAVGLKAKRDLFGKYTVSGYGKGGGATHDFSELGVDENKLFKKIKRIKGTADFRESNVTDLGNLKQIDGDIFFYYDKLTPQVSDITIKHKGKRKNFSRDESHPFIYSNPAIPEPNTPDLEYIPRYPDHIEIYYLLKRCRPSAEIEAEYRKNCCYTAI